MTKRKWVLIAIALLLAFVYIYHFSVWFKTKIIQISYTDRSFPARTPSRSSFPTILFGFGGHLYQISEIKVVPLAAWQTNLTVSPVWHLVSNSRSAPMEFFRYGEDVPGMKPAVPGARAEPLETNVTYRLLLRAGSYQGQCDFQMGGRPPAKSPNP
jgi:hypothetical protein